MFRRRIQNKMDSARALSLMGFSSTRFMDKSTGIDPKTSLDQALSQQMQILVMKKRDALKERKQKELEEAKKRKNISKYTEDMLKREAKLFKMSLDPTSNWTAYSNVSFLDNDDTYPTNKKSSIRSKEEKYAEDILSLHEAYQFLLKRYVLPADTRHKLKHAMATINNVNKLLLSDDEGMRSDDINPEDEVESDVEVQCGACKLIQQIEGMSEHECELKMKEIVENGLTTD